MNTKILFQKKVKIAICVIFSLVFTFHTLFCQTNLKSYSPKAVQIRPIKAHPFMAGEVRLLDGPFKDSQNAEAKTMLDLDINRLLAPFLIESGLTPKGPIYLGWETRVLPGVGLSFYLSGMARLYESTGSKEFFARINYALSELELCQQKNGGYLLGTKNGKKIFERVEKEGCFPGFGHWELGEATPYYSLEKLLSGLRDVYRICRNAKALQISIGIGNWLCKHMSSISDVELQKIMQIEYGGMNWVLADLYADTGDKRYLELSKRWQDNITVNPMVQGIDKLTGKHANMQFPKYSGLAARYPYSGEAGDLFGAKFFWENVVYHRSYVTGGNSESEYFAPKDSLRSRLTPFTEENCNEYNMLRLTSLLFQIEPKVEYADYMERTLFNHILAAQNPAEGKVCYFLPLIPGAKKNFVPTEEFSCCVCSAFDSYTRNAEYIYDYSDSAIFVNLFIPSELNYREKGILIRQETSFPDKNISTLKIKCDYPVSTDLCIRNPYWANNEVTIKINGKRQKVAAPEKGYFHIRRNWSNGDVVELMLPMSLRTESMPDDKNMVALFYGPVLLAACFDDKEAENLTTYNLAPALVPGKLSLDKWLKPAGEPLTYTTTVSEPNQVKVMPFFRKKTGAYSVYWQKLSHTEWLKREGLKQQKSDEDKRLDLFTVDKVRACDQNSETEHKLSGNSKTGNGNGGIFTDRCWRRSLSGFGYEMSVSDSGQNSLFCRYMGRDPYERWSCRITVDGTTIQTLNREKDDSYPVVIWQSIYTIPYELTKGKKKVKVFFEPIKGSAMQMPKLMELRIINR